MPFHSFFELVDLAALGLLEPLLAFGDPTKRTYAPFLLGSLVIAILVWSSSRQKRASLFAYLLPRRVWLHRSALLDYRLTFARSVLQFTLLSPLAVSEVIVAATVASWLWGHVGHPLPPGAIDRHWVTVLYGLTAFLAEDLAQYVVHRLAHRVPVLWELHKVHHSAEVLTPMTVHRVHPIEALLLRVSAQATIGVVTGLVLWLFPGRLRPWEIMGVHGLSFVWGMLGANLRHSHVWLSYGPLLEHVFISPAQHQIHHGDRRDQHDTNFGVALAIWDWLFGSLRVTTRQRPALRFGLPPDVRNHDDTIASSLVDPMIAALRALGGRGAHARGTNERGGRAHREGQRGSPSRIDARTGSPSEANDHE